jgi:alcohol dehydrogenase (NADP+)
LTAQQSVRTNKRINMVDMNEKEIGDTFTDAFSNGVVKRSEVFVTSKLWNDKHHPSAVRQACMQTLSDLKLEYLDLYLMHWPLAFRPGTSEIDPSVPLPDTWKEMEKLVDDGLVRHIGVR